MFIFIYFYFFLGLTQFWLSLKCGGRNFGPPLLVSLFLPFIFIFLSFSSSLSLFISFFPLIFLLHFIISSHKKHFSKLLNSPSSISINISLDLPVLSNFIPHPFSKTHFLCIKMASSSKGSSFLASHGKKYDPTFEWHDDNGLLQDPRTHAPYCHVDTKVSFSW